MSRPVLLIHGPGLHATSWQPWIDHFAAAGLTAVAPHWPGEGSTVRQTRENPDLVGGCGLDAATRHHRALAGALPQLPLVVGHSLGGLIAARLLADGRAMAGVCLDADPTVAGLPEPLPALRAQLPALREPANAGRAFSLTAAQFHDTYGQGLDRTESDDLHERWAVPAPVLPFLETAGPVPAPRRPLLVVRTVASAGPSPAPPGTVVHTLPGRGHLLTMTAGWREIAELCRSWLTATT